MVALIMLVFSHLKESRLGRAWIAIREDEDAARAMGIRTGPIKILAFLCGATLAGFAGAFFAHKTGTGQDLGSLSTGYNDIGLLVAPNGHRYAVAVMIASTRDPIPVRMRMMGDVTRAVVASVGN